MDIVKILTLTHLRFGRQSVCSSTYQFVIDSQLLTLRHGQTWPRLCCYFANAHTQEATNAGWCREYGNWDSLNVTHTGIAIEKPLHISVCNGHLSSPGLFFDSAQVIQSSTLSVRLHLAVKWRSQPMPLIRRNCRTHTTWWWRSKLIS